MRVLILRTPASSDESLVYLKEGMVYEVPATLASYLVAERFAIFERRVGGNAESAPIVERRKKRTDVA